MSKLICLLVVLVSLIAVLACSGADPSTVFSVATTAGGVPITTAIPEGRDSRRAQAIVPLKVDDPQTFLRELSPGERSCLSDNNIGTEDLQQITGRSPGGFPEASATITNCLQDETVLRLFLTSLVGQVEPFSQETSMCIREGVMPSDLRGLLAPAAAGDAPVTSLTLGMALNVSVACMSDDEWDAYAPRLGMQPEGRKGTVCLFEELGGSKKLLKAMRAAHLGEPPKAFMKANQVCGLEPLPPSTVGLTTIPTATPFPSQPHIILRVVLVTEDWVPFSSAGGWTEAVIRKESEVLRYYEAAIWEETDSVRLYAFPNDYDPLFGIFGDVPDSEIIAYREQYAIRVHEGMPEESSDERSKFLKAAFKDFAHTLTQRHPDAEHHLMFNGHGGPGGDLFAQQLKNLDADAFLATWTELLSKPLGVIDMGGPCNKGGYEDMANFCKYTRYYVASDLPNGGYGTDEWTLEKFLQVNAETQYHQILRSAETLEEALIARVELQRKDYEYSRTDMVNKKIARASYVYSCAAFSDFSTAFESFLDETIVLSPPYDLYELLLDYAESPSLLEKFHNVILHSVDNRDFFTWNVSSNGMITPLERIYRRWEASELPQR